MPTPYDTIEKISEVICPLWSYTWPGQGGCGGIYVSDNDHSAACPSSTQMWYEPEVVTVTKDTRNLKGLRRGSAIPYFMTPRNVSKRVDREHLVKTNHGNYGITVYHQKGVVRPNPTYCEAVLESTEQIGPVTTEWREVGRFFPYTTYSVSGFNEANINDVSTRLQQTAALDALCSYDFLTEIAEAREIPQMFNAVFKDITTIYRAFNNRWKIEDLRRLFQRNGKFLHLRTPKTHGLRDLQKLFADSWMTFRYSIMPLAYSLRDIQKVIDQGFQQLVKKSATITPTATNVTLPPVTDRYKWTDAVGEVKLRASVRSWYSWEALSRLDSIGFNPFVTAWELIPYSFVFDWFVNMGDYIARTTTQSLAKERYACISRRDSVITRTWVHLPRRDETITFSVGRNYPWNGYPPPAAPPKVINNPEGSQLLQSTEINSYVRGLYTVSDASLLFNPNLNWRRWMDSAVMTKNLFAGLVKKFRLR